VTTVTRFVTSPGRWQKSLASAASMADVVCLGAVPCRRSSTRRAARLRSLAAVVPGGSGARWREGARGAVLEHRSEARSAEVRAPVFAARSASASAPRRRSRRHHCSTAWRGARSRRRRAEERSSRAPQARAAARSRAPCPGPSATERSEFRSPPAVSA
jgi:hypothetical protein